MKNMLMMMTKAAVAKLSDKELANLIQSTDLKAETGPTVSVRAMAKTQANWLREQLRARRRVAVS